MLAVARVQYYQLQWLNCLLVIGYRTASNGTAWSYFSFIADYFDFNEFYTTYSFDTAMNYLKTDNDNDGNSDYYIIVSCGSGLFTTGGHYIVLVANNDDTITVYDPYLYSGKFDTASRKSAGVVVSGNSVYVTESVFKQYANAKCYWVFSNDEGDDNTNATTTDTSSTVNYIRYVATQSANLNVRDNPNGNKIESLTKGTQVTVEKVDGNWSYITSPVAGWVSSSYLSSTAVSTTSTNTSYSTSIGNYYRLKNKTTLYASPSMSGTSYNYLAQTQIKVVSHYSSNIDYVYIIKTGRYAYCYTSAFTSSSSSNSTTTASTVGNYYRLSTKTKLYSSSSMSGTYYTYLANTQVKVLQNVTNSIDYVQVVKTRQKSLCL